jgi:hypothetical protein
LNAIEEANPTISNRDRFAIRRTTFENSTWYKTLPLAARIQRPFPTTTGQVFVIDDFYHIVTQTDMGFNYFMGNTG